MIRYHYFLNLHVLFTIAAFAQAADNQSVEIVSGSEQEQRLHTTVSAFGRIVLNGDILDVPLRPVQCSMFMGVGVPHMEFIFNDREDIICVASNGLNVYGVYSCPRSSDYECLPADSIADAKGAFQKALPFLKYCGLSESKSDYTITSSHSCPGGDWTVSRKLQNGGVPCRTRGVELTFLVSGKLVMFRHNPVVAPVNQVGTRIPNEMAAEAAGRHLKAHPYFSRVGSSIDVREKDMIEAIAPDVNYISLLEKTPKLTIQYPTNTAEKGFTFLYCWEVPVAIMREGKVGGLYVVWVNSRTGEVIGGDFDWERMLIDR